MTSTSFKTAMSDFSKWYESKPQEIQFLIDEISDKTSFIVNEDAYDEFITILADYSITTAEEFEDSFCGEYEGVGEFNHTKFAKDFISETGCLDCLPEMVTECIDYEMMYFKSLQYDHFVFTCLGNTYFFKNN
jgi:hypothetical protein